MMGFLHVYMKYTQPLFIQSLMGLKGLYDAKPVAIHLLGKPAVGDLKRPFKAASMFGGEHSALLCLVTILKLCSQHRRIPRWIRPPLSKRRKR